MKILKNPKFWTINDVSAWLENDNLGNYVKLFKFHKINGTILLKLTEEDFRREPMLLNCLGDIKRIVMKIRKLKCYGLNHRLTMTRTNIYKSRLPLKHTAKAKTDMDQSKELFSNFSNINEQAKDFVSKSSYNSLSIPVVKHGLKTASLRSGHTSTNNKNNNLCTNYSHNSYANGYSNHNNTIYNKNNRKRSVSSTNTHDSNNLCEEDALIIKLLLAFAYSLFSFLVTSVIMVIVHDRVPDINKYPPLPDIFLDNIPLIPGAFLFCEQIGILLGLTLIVACIFHKHRFIILRRFFALTGTVFMLRCVTMVITSLSVPGAHLNCHHDMVETATALNKIKRAFKIWSGFGMSLVGIHTCGDYMFSGHTVILTMLNFFITEYTPRSFYLLHTFSWVLNLFGIFFILAAHEHYSIDVFIAFYITTRLFLYYHSLANNRALRQLDGERVRSWFPMFSYFESKVEGIIPNEYELPFVDRAYALWSMLNNDSILVNNVKHHLYAKTTSLPYQPILTTSTSTYMRGEPHYSSSHTLPINNHAMKFKMKKHNAIFEHSKHHYE